MSYVCPHVTIDPTAMEALRREAARRRFSNASTRQTSNRRAVNLSEEEIDMMGVIGEYAVSRYFDIPFPWGGNPGRDESGVDLVVGEWTVQVKMTNSPDKNFLVAGRGVSALKSQRGVLAFQGFDRNIIFLRGWLSREEFIKYAIPLDLPKGWSMAYPAAWLHPMEAW